MSERAPRPPGSVAARAPGPKAPPPYRLIVDTVESGAAVGERRPPPAAYGIEVRETIVGREPAADIRLDDEFVSRRHAVLLLRDHELHLEDLGSTNGTRRNGDLVETRVQVRPGDVLEFGKSLCRIESGFPAPVEDPERDGGLEETPEDDEGPPEGPEAGASPWTLLARGIAAEFRRNRLVGLGIGVVVIALILFVVAVLR